MDPIHLVGVTPAGQVHRVGFAPDPWAWPGWEWATDGRFNGRWDDAAGNFRTIYAGSTLFACLVEVLAPLRSDPELAAALEDIDVDDVDQAQHPTQPAGTVPYSCRTPVRRHRNARRHLLRRRRRRHDRRPPATLPRPSDTTRPSRLRRSRPQRPQPAPADPGSCDGALRHHRLRRCGLQLPPR